MMTVKSEPEKYNLTFLIFKAEKKSTVINRVWFTKNKSLNIKMSEFKLVNLP